MSGELFFEMDALDTAHKIGIVLVFIVIILALFGYLKMRRTLKKSEVRISDSKFLWLILLIICVSATMFINGIVEIVFGILAMISAIYFVKESKKQRKIKKR